MMNLRGNRKRPKMCSRTARRDTNTNTKDCCCGLLVCRKKKKNTSAGRSSKNDFDQNSVLQAACDTSIARVINNRINTEVS